MTRKEATDKAIAAGATADEIAAETALQARRVGTTPFNNMIRALQMMTYLNTRSDWTRLAAALTARANRRGKA